MTEPFRTRRRVEFADTDMAGIAHFANFFRWMEAAEVDYLASRGPGRCEKLGSSS